MRFCKLSGRNGTLSESSVMVSNRRPIQNLTLSPVRPVCPLCLTHRNRNKPLADIQVEFLNRFPGSSDQLNTGDTSIWQKCYSNHWDVRSDASEQPWG